MSKVKNEPTEVLSCFVVMPFREPHGRRYPEIYVPAIADAGLRPKRADDLFRPSPIIGDIWKYTREAAVILADLSEINANVFYVLGLAHARSKPVVMVSDSLVTIPFDLQGLRILIFDKEDSAWGAKLQAGITTAITEILRDPIEAVPFQFREMSPTGSPQEEVLSAELRGIREEVRALRATLKPAAAPPPPVPVLTPEQERQSRLQGHVSDGLFMELYAGTGKGWSMEQVDTVAALLVEGKGEEAVQLLMRERGQVKDAEIVRQAVSRQIDKLVRSGLANP